MNFEIFSSLEKVQDHCYICWKMIPDHEHLIDDQESEKQFRHLLLKIRSLRSGEVADRMKAHGFITG